MQQIECSFKDESFLVLRYDLECCYPNIELDYREKYRIREGTVVLFKGLFEHNNAIIISFIDIMSYKQAYNFYTHKGDTPLYAFKNIIEHNFYELAESEYNVFIETK